MRADRQRVDTPAKAIGVGDVLTVAVARTTAVVRVEALGMRRGPAPEARELYRELERDDGSAGHRPP